MNLANELSDRYVAVWNEPDPERRRAMVADLWTDDGEHVLMPPQEAREAAAAQRMQAAFEAPGHRGARGPGEQCLRAVHRLG